MCINYLRQDADTAGHPFPRLRSCNPLPSSLCLHGFYSALPAVYQVYRRKALRAKAFRRFSFYRFGSRSTRCLPSRFFEGETRGFLPLFCVLSTFWSMQGALCCHSWVKVPFSSSLREFLPCFGRELSSAPEFKRRNSNEKPEDNGKVAEGYKNLTKEVIKLEKQREKSRAGSIR